MSEELAMMGAHIEKFNLCSAYAADIVGILEGRNRDIAAVRLKALRIVDLCESAFPELKTQMDPLRDLRLSHNPEGHSTICWHPVIVDEI